MDVDDHWRHGRQRRKNMRHPLGLVDELDAVCVVVDRYDMRLMVDRHGTSMVV